MSARNIQPVNFSYIDGANLFIGGMQVAAARRGLATSPRDAGTRGVADRSWRLDFRRLYSLLFPATHGQGQAVIVGSSTDPGTARWTSAAEAAGFRVLLLPRAAGAREKQVDVALACQAMKDMRYMQPGRGDSLTLVSGDGDFLPMVNEARAAGLHVTTRSWGHAENPQLAAAATSWPLDPHFHTLTYDPAR